MATFEYISARGDVLKLSESESFHLVNIDAQTAAATNISSAVVGGVDGDIINNIQTQPRTIILDLRITNNVEITKRQILNIVKLKQKATLQWNQNNKKLKIHGVVESIEMPRWTNGVIMQIALHCEIPYWEDIDEIISEIGAAIGLHYFTEYPDDMLYFEEEGIVLGEYDTTRTKSFYNAGDVDIGLQIEIIAYDTVTNPIIYNQENKFFGCGYGSGGKQVVMHTGDVIRISTVKNEKSVTLNGESILGKIKPRSTWLQLAAGENTFAIQSDDEGTIENMSFALKYKQLYI